MTLDTHQLTMQLHTRLIEDVEATYFGKGESYPLNCFSSVDDGFSGWFAISDEKKCSDFCFWDSTTLPYTPNNTADPHVTTIAPNKDQWRCAFQADGDDITLDDFKSMARKQNQPWLEHNDTFSYLRCQGGAGDIIESTGYNILNSMAFWSIMLALSLLLFGFEVWRVFRRWKQMREQHENYEEEKSDQNDDYAGVVEENKEDGKINDSKMSIPDDSDDLEKNKGGDYESRKTVIMSTDLYEGKKDRMDNQNSSINEGDVSVNCFECGEGSCSGEKVIRRLTDGGQNSAALLVTAEAKNSASDGLADDTTKILSSDVTDSEASKSECVTEIEPNNNFILDTPAFNGAVGSVNAAAGASLDLKEIITSATDSALFDKESSFSDCKVATVDAGIEEVEDTRESQECNIEHGQNSGKAFVSNDSVGDRENENLENERESSFCSQMMENGASLDYTAKNSALAVSSSQKHSNSENLRSTRKENNSGCCNKVILCRRILACWNRTNLRRWKKCCLICCIIFTNVLLAFASFISIVSLIQLRGTYTSFTLQQFTPFCTDPSVVCARANSDIDRPSSKEQRSTEPFSYLIGSDVQLDWYDGESAYIGSKNYFPCTESMSCEECTGVFGKHTNTQMKKSMEMLTNGVNPAHTLVMNGDLTAYFHRPQRLKYESFYQNMDAGIISYYPALGNHDYDHSSATYNGDQWVGPKSCNAAHSLGYLKGGFCGEIPRFDPQRVVRYHAQSLAYSWEEGNYHFVHVHYYPNFEHSKIGLGSSMEWLQRDLDLAYAAGLATVLFVHAAQGLNQVMERILSGRRVVAIFAGHTHRCLLNKCEGLTRLSVADTEDPKILEKAQKCLPATVNLCGDNANGNFMSLFYLNDVDPDYSLPERELFYPLSNNGDLCPKPSPPYINKTDQTLLCRRSVFNEPNFSVVNSNKSIPIFWSGSASFETFLKTDFYEDRLVINAMTAKAGMEGQRYVDTHDLPNAVYPHHNRTDLEEVVIFI